MTFSDELEKIELEEERDAATFVAHKLGIILAFSLVANAALGISYLESKFGAKECKCSSQNIKPTFRSAFFAIGSMILGLAASSAV